VLYARSRARGETAVGAGGRCHGTSQNQRSSASSRAVCHVRMLWTGRELVGAGSLIQRTPWVWKRGGEGRRYSSLVVFDSALAVYWARNTWKVHEHATSANRLNSDAEVKKVFSCDLERFSAVFFGGLKELVCTSPRRRGGLVAIGRATGAPVLAKTNRRTRGGVTPDQPPTRSG
jgi:hypothetical protein